MTSTPSAPQPAPELSEEDLARIENSKRLITFMLLAMGAGVLGVIAFGLYQMAALILANT